MVPEAEGRKKADEIGALFASASAKLSTNVDHAFLSVGHQLVAIKDEQRAQNNNSQTAMGSAPTGGVQLGSAPPRGAVQQKQCCGGNFKL